jgi:crotonobetainyl-CoA:carnitine CoA-transferase CaiB-like acyl-CoA transferase
VERHPGPGHPLRRPHGGAAAARAVGERARQPVSLSRWPLVPPRANARSLIAILDDVFAKKDWAEWRAILERSGIAFGVVGTLEDIPADRQMVDGGALVPIDDPRAGASLTVSSPLEIDGQPKTKPTLAPGVGEHTTDVLREAGFTETEIERLLRTGVVAQGLRA